MVSDEDFDKALVEIIRLKQALLTVERRLYFNESWLDTIESYLIHTGGQTTEERADLANRLKKIKMAIYDERLARLSDDDPTKAAYVDVRPFLSPDNQKQWLDREASIDPPPANGE